MSSVPPSCSSKNRKRRRLPRRHPGMAIAWIFTMKAIASTAKIVIPSPIRGCSRHQRHDRDDQDHVTDHLNHKGGGKKLERVVTSPSARSMIHRGLGLVKRGRVRGVLGKFDPHLVGCRPAHMPAEVGGGQAQRLISDGESTNPAASAISSKVGTLGSAVYECPDQLWIDDLEGNPRQQQGEQNQHPGSERAEVLSEGANRRVPGSCGSWIGWAQERQRGGVCGARRPVGRVSGLTNAPGQRVGVGFLNIASLLRKPEETFAGEGEACQ